MRLKKAYQDSVLGLSATKRSELTQNMEEILVCKGKISIQHGLLVLSQQ